MLFILLFFIWPFLAFVLVLPSRVPRIVKMLVVVGFTTVMGANIYYVNVTGDAVRYAEHFREDTTYGINILDFISAGRIDVLHPLSNVFVGMFTRNPRVLLSLYGMLYGLLIFLSLDKAYCLIKDNYFVGVNKKHTPQTKEKSMFTIFIMVMMYFVNPMTHMGTFRYFFSVWLFFYGWLIYTKGNTRLGICLMLITPLIHTSFAVPLLLFVIHMFVKIPTKMLFVGVILCFILGNILYMQDYMHGISVISESERYSGYLQEETFEARIEMAERMSIINVVSQFVSKYVFFGILLYLHFVINKFEFEGKNKVVSIYNFMLLYYCFAYLFMQVPSMVRYLVLANMFLLYLVGILFTKGLLRHKRILYSLISLAMVGQIYLSIIPNNVSRFDLKYLYPIIYL